ncbi:N-lysine methyltransferase KMT5A-like [Paramacrobiotus metropolitanus]|uniref:N-lysine methyltransferase KMT5A-like n=1 Tax=Paramacrobiotus metropolitanus TaxID=2943436 RepID=UPI00244639A6|nr:N-lysine methyltransferase KMT5A-like [Paramacrobiotus metropolitanus]
MPPKKPVAPTAATRRNPPRNAASRSFKQTKLDEVLHRAATKPPPNDLVPAAPSAPEPVVFEENLDGDLVECGAAVSEFEVVSVAAQKISKHAAASGLPRPSPLKIVIRKRAVQLPKVPPNTPQKNGTLPDGIANGLPPSTPVQRSSAVRGHQIISPETTVIPRKGPKIGRPALPGTTTVKSNPVVRQTKSERVKASLELDKRLKEEEITITRMIVSKLEDPGIQIHLFEEKGRGLVAQRAFKKDEYVVEYAGDLVDVSCAKQRERYYAQEPSKYGCYMYFFNYKGRRLCVDATAETGRYGRLLNHSCRRANLRPEVKEIPSSEQKIHLILRAARDIEVGEELLYDYGDRDPQSLAAFPWLKEERRVWMLRHYGNMNNQGDDAPF